MTRTTLARFLKPWMFKREQAQLRLAELRSAMATIARDAGGRSSSTGRRAMSWPRRSRRSVPGPRDGALANLCLTHGRCNVQGRDHTDEVLERLRPAREAELFAKARKKRAA